MSDQQQPPAARGGRVKRVSRPSTSSPDDLPTEDTTSKPDLSPPVTRQTVVAPRPPPEFPKTSTPTTTSSQPEWTKNRKKPDWSKPPTSTSSPVAPESTVRHDDNQRTSTSAIPSGRAATPSPSTTMASNNNNKKPTELARGASVKPTLALVRTQKGAVLNHDEPHQHGVAVEDKVTDQTKSKEFSASSSPLAATRKSRVQRPGAGAVAPTSPTSSEDGGDEASASATQSTSVSSSAPPKRGGRVARRVSRPPSTAPTPSADQSNAAPATPAPRVKRGRIKREYVRAEDVKLKENKTAVTMKPRRRVARKPRPVRTDVRGAESGTDNTASSSSVSSPTPVPRVRKGRVARGAVTTASLSDSSHHQEQAAPHRQETETSEAEEKINNDGNYSRQIVADKDHVVTTTKTPKPRPQAEAPVSLAPLKVAKKTQAVVAPPEPAVVEAAPIVVKPKPYEAIVLKPVEPKKAAPPPPPSAQPAVVENTVVSPKWQKKPEQQQTQLQVTKAVEPPLPPKQEDEPAEDVSSFSARMNKFKKLEAGSPAVPPKKVWPPPTTSTTPPPTTQPVFRTLKPVEAKATDLAMSSSASKPFQKETKNEVQGRKKVEEIQEVKKEPPLWKEVKEKKEQMLQAPPPVVVKPVVVPKSKPVDVPEPHPVAVSEPKSVTILKPKPVVVPEANPVGVPEPKPVVAPKPKPGVIPEPTEEEDVSDVEENTLGKDDFVKDAPTVDDESDDEQIEEIKTPKPRPRPPGTRVEITSLLSQGKFSDIYDLGDELGTGAFAVVNEVFNIKTGEPYAAKIITCSALSKEDNEDLKDEVLLLRELKHHGIVQLLDVFFEDGCYYLVMEEMFGGELFDRVVEKQCYKEDEAREICTQLFDAIKYCHDRRIAHRDIKPENLLLESMDSDTNVKLADFGFAKKAWEPNCLKTYCGTPSYVAPEILDGLYYDVGVDMWSLGVVIYVLMGGYSPFGNEDDILELYRAILEADFEFHNEWWGDVSDEAKDMISALLTVEPEDRMTADEALDFAKLEWGAP